MTRHLLSVDGPTKPRRLNSRRDLDLWVAERYAVLTALAREERLGQREPQFAVADRVHVQLELGEAA